MPRKALHNHERAETLGAIANRVATTSLVTFEEYLDSIDEDTRAEWVDGTVLHMTSPAGFDHQDLDQFLVEIMAPYVRANELGRIILPPFVMRLGSSAREPDLLFVESANLGRVTSTYLDGPADLVVELVSPESATRDRVTKLVEYEAAGIREYWLFDSQEHTSAFYQLSAQGRFHQVRPDSRNIYHSSTVSGFWLRVDWLWQQPHPDPLDVLLEIAPATYATYMRERLRKAGLGS